MGRRIESCTGFGCHPNSRTAVPWRNGDMMCISRTLSRVSKTSRSTTFAATSPIRKTCDGDPSARTLVDMGVGGMFQELEEVPITILKRLAGLGVMEAFVGHCQLEVVWTFC